MKFKIHPYSFFITLSIVLLVFQYSIALIIPSITYYDEIFPILAYANYLLRIRKIKKEDFWMHIFYILTVIFGILGNFSSNVHLNALIDFSDAISILKPLIALHVIKNTITNLEGKRILNNCKYIFSWYIYIAIFVWAIAYMFNFNNFFVIERVRYGIKPYRFICENEGIFGYIVMAMVTLLNFSDVNNKIVKYTKFFGLVLIASTTKGPQLIFVALYIFFYLIRLKKLRAYHIVVVAFIGLFLGQYQLTHYFKPTEARYLLIVTGFSIAMDYLPIGSGFGTFGSEMSRHFTYSTIYNDYGLSNVYGLSEQYNKFITDNYWPMLMGQLGFILFGVFLFYYYKLFRSINMMKNRNAQQKQVMIVSFITFIIGSIGSAYLTSFVGVLNFIIWSIYLSPQVELNG